MRLVSLCKRRVKIFLAVLCCMSATAGGGYYVYRRHLAAVEARRAELRMEQRQNAWLRLKQEIAACAADKEIFTGIVIRDLTVGWEMNCNKEKRMPAASLTKIPLMLCCYQAGKEQKIRLDDVITLKNSHKTGGSGTLKNMPAGTKITIERLIELMITKSDNTAANILIELLGTEYINAFFRSFGLEETKLARRMMDFTSRKKGIENYTTAGEMAGLLEGIYRGGFLGRETAQRCLWLLKHQEYNDRLPARLPAGTVVAHKTGLERRVCHDAGILFTAKGDFLICVLTRAPKSGKSSKKAKEVIADIAFWVYRYAESL